MPEDDSALQTSSLPSLRLTKSHVSLSKPNGGLFASIPLNVDERSQERVAIASNDTVQLLDDRLRLVNTLLFADAFPSGTSKANAVSVVAQDIGSPRGRIVAASADRVALWEKGARAEYRVHSTFSTGFKITCVDVCADTMVAAGESRLAIFQLDNSSGLPVWSRKCSIELSHPAQAVKLADKASVLACSYQKHHIAQVYRISRSSSQDVQLVLLSEPWHPRPIQSILWLPTTSAAALMIQTHDGVCRVWRSLTDELDCYVLWCSIDPTFVLGSQIVSNFWIEQSSILKDSMVSIARNGQIAVVSITNLRSAASSTAKINTRKLPQVMLNTAQLSRLRYSFAYPAEGGLSVFGCSKAAEVIHLHLNLGPSPAASIRTRLTSRLQPSQRIQKVVAAPTKRFFATIGTSGEVIVWKSRSAAGRTALMDAQALYRPDEDLGDDQCLHAAIDTEGKLLFAVFERTTLLLKRNHANLEATDIEMSGMPAIKTITAVTLLNGSSDSQLIILDTRGVIRLWDLRNPTPTLLFTSKSVVSSLRLASFDHHSAEPATLRLAVVDENDSISEISIALDGKPRILSCSGQHQVAFVEQCEEGDILKIHNTRTSLFTTGTEYSQQFDATEPIHSLAFGITPDNLYVLLVTLPSRIVVVAERRMEYYQESSLWSQVASIPIRSRAPAVEAQLTMDMSVFVAAASNTFLFSRDLEGVSNFSDISSRISSNNAPLSDYHPDLLLQCLLFGKFAVVDRILSGLASALRRTMEDEEAFFYQPAPVADFIEEREHAAAGNSDFFLSSLSVSSSPHFTAEEAKVIHQAIEVDQIPDLTAPDRKRLGILVETLLQVANQRRALDTNGMRFLLSVKSFAIAQANQHPPSDLDGQPSLRLPSQPLARLRYRDVLWAFHSQSQEILLQACNDVCGRPMLWEDARALGISFWVRSTGVLAQQLEIVARNEYTAPEDRDPTVCSLYYFALRKKRLVQGLWRQATFHKERGLMLKFLMNDSDESRWQSAALKNAYALLGKQRFHYAAAFFLLGDSLKDCVNVCLRQLNDFHLAIVLARVYEGDDGPVLRNILDSHVLPLAFAKGYRRLASWAFWMLKRRDLAVQIIVLPFADMVASLNNPAIKEIGSPAQEDPSLILLYGQLRDFSLQTLKGSSALSPFRETQFVLHIAQVFGRMGCQVLALDLVRNWEFRSARDQILALIKHEAPRSGAVPRPGPGPHERRRSSRLAPKRRSTVILDVPSAVPSRASSPERLPTIPNGAPPARNKQLEEAEGFKKVVREVKAPPAEFDMSAFGF